MRAQEILSKDICNVMTAKLTICAGTASRVRGQHPQLRKARSKYSCQFTSLIVKQMLFLSLYSDVQTVLSTMVSSWPIRISSRTGTQNVTPNATPAVIRFSHEENTFNRAPLCISHEFCYLQQRYYFEDNVTIILNRAQITA